VLAQYYVVKLK